MKIEMIYRVFSKALYSNNDYLVNFTFTHALIFNFDICISIKSMQCAQVVGIPIFPRISVCVSAYARLPDQTKNDVDL